MAKKHPHKPTDTLHFGATDPDAEPATITDALDLDAGDPERLPPVPADGTEADPLHDLPPAVVTGTPVKGRDGLNRTGFDRAAANGPVPALDPLGLATLPRFRVSCPTDPTLPATELQAQTKGDAEVAFRELNGIVIQGRPLMVIGPL